MIISLTPHHRNLKIHQTFSGTRDEEWFLLISLAIEAKGGPILRLILAAMKAICEQEDDRLMIELTQLSRMIKEVAEILNRMNDKVN